jgi:hypothetical protein
MQSYPKEQDGASQERRTRFQMYWLSAVAGTILFLFFVTIMLMVPGILPDEKLFMLSIAGIVLAGSLGIGAWRFSTTDAPLAAQPFGPFVGVLLLIELAMCVVSIFHILVWGGR